LFARIDEIFPLVCPRCGGDMRVIAFITDGPSVRDILGHRGEPTAPPRIAIARPHAATLASVPARQCPDQRAEQPAAIANRRLTRPIGPSTFTLARLK